MNNIYPTNISPEFYLIQVGIAIGYVIEPGDDVPETREALDAFLLDKFGLKIESKRYSSSELRNKVFDALSLHMSKKLPEIEFEIHLGKSHRDAAAFEHAMNVIE